MKKKNLSLILSVVGAIVLASSIFFLENIILSGICFIIGLSLLIIGGLLSTNKLEFIINAILIWLAHSIRFCTIFGYSFWYILIIFGLFIPFAIILSVGILITKKILKTKYYYFSILIIPSFYALMMFILTIANIGFVPNGMTYLMQIIPFMLSLSFLGEFGITFIFMLIIMLFVIAIVDQHKLTRIIYLIVASVLLIVPFTIGCVIYNNRPSPSYSIKVTLATCEESGMITDYEACNDLAYQLNMFKSALDKASLDNSDLLLLNEEYFIVDEDKKNDLYNDLSLMISTYNIPVLVGTEVYVEDGLWTNEVAYFNSSGEIEFTYLKNNLIPFVEAGYYVDGKEEPAYLTTNIGGHDINLAVVICLDLNDSNYIKMIPSSTELLIVPSWDWNTVNIEQIRTKVRSIELNTTIIKNTYCGFSYIATPYGSDEEMIDFRTIYESAITITVPIWEK